MMRDRRTTSVPKIVRSCGRAKCGESELILKGIGIYL